MIDLYLIRHAESEANIFSDRAVGGRIIKTPLSERGIVQARYLKEHLPNFDTVYVSPAARTLQTASYAGIENIIQETSLLERSLGEWEGKPTEEIYTPEVLNEITSQGWDYSPPGGESKQDVEDRFYNWFNSQEFSKDTEYKKIGVFTHEMVIKAFLKRALDESPKEIYERKINNASVTNFKYDKGLWTPIKINEAYKND